MKRLIVDLDGTITQSKNNEYSQVSPRSDVIETLRQYKKQGFDIVIYTARNMRTFEGNLGKINIHTLPIIIQWLDKHQVPYDEILMGKPWCGYEGFYVDDKAIRPSEFTQLTYEQITRLLKKEQECI